MEEDGGGRGDVGGRGKGLENEGNRKEERGISQKQGKGKRER